MGRKLLHKSLPKNLIHKLRFTLLKSGHLHIFFSLEGNLLKSNIRIQREKWQLDRNEGVNAFRIQLPSYMGDYLFK